MDRLPYFPFYADDFLMGVSDMTDAEAGIYIKLLSISWSKNGANDQATLAASRDDNAIKRVLDRKFYRDECGLWRNEKLEGIREKQGKKREAGSKGGSKTQANGEANRQAKSKRQNQNQSITKSASASADDARALDSNNSSSSEETTSKPSSSANKARFDAFWNVVHRKTGKAAAERAFSKAVKRFAKDQHLKAADAADAITTAMEDFAASPAAHPASHSPIHPATWLNQGRYEDDPETWQHQPQTTAEQKMENLARTAVNWKPPELRNAD